jgi:predicted Zn-dependent peptidase
VTISHSGGATELFGPSPAQVSALAGFDRRQSFRLKCGATLVVLPRPDSPSLAIRVYVGSGSQFEGPAQHGLAHLLEHCLFRATQRRSGSQIYAAVENIGGQVNAFTHREYLSLAAQVPASYWRPVLDLLCEVLTMPLFDPAQVEQEKKVVLEEIARRQDAQSQLWDLWLETIWGVSGFTRPMLGTAETVNALQVADLWEFYRQRFSGPNTVFALVGAVNPPEVRLALEQALAGYPGHPVASFLPDRAGLPVVYPPRQLKIGKNTLLTTLLVGWPTVTQYDRENHYRLKVLNRLLGVGGTSWLWQSLREQHNLVYSVQSASVNYATLGYLATRLTVQPHNLDKVVAALTEQISRLLPQTATNGLSQAEVDRSRVGYEGSLAVQYDSNARLSEHLGLNALMGIEDTFQYAVEQLRTVQITDLQALASRFFSTPPYLALVGP